MKNLFKKFLAIGLAASMTLGMAVTSIAEGEENPAETETPVVEETDPTEDPTEDPAEDPAEPEAPAAKYDAEVWVNGKDVKENKDKGIKADLNKTANVLLADLLTTQEKAAFSAVETYEGWKIDTTAAKGEGVLTYDYRVVASAEGLKVEIVDSSKLAVGTYTYSEAVVDNEETTDVDETAAAKWADSNGKTLDEKAVKITGTPKANDKIDVILDWNNDLGITVSSVGEGYEFKVGDKITIVQDVQTGLSKELPEKTKYVVSVLDAPVAEEGKDVVANTLEDAFDDKGKGVKSTKASAKFDKKTAAFKVTAGKVAGDVEIWIAEYNSTKKAITAYASFNVAVKEAPKKFSVVIPAKKEIKDEETGEVLREATEAIEKKFTTVASESVLLEVAFPEGAAKPHEDATYTWSVKAPKNEAAYVINDSVEYTDAELDAFEKAYETANVRVEGMNDCANIEFAKLSNPTKGGTYTITCVNDQSGKKASFKITVVNNITDIELPSITVANAYTEKQTTELVLGDEKGYFISTNLWEMVGEGELKELATTDKIKAYVTSNIKLSGKYNAEGELDPKAEMSYYGFELTKGEKSDKFKLTEKSKDISAKLDKTGKLIVTAKKGILPGTQAKLVLAVTHKDKRIETYETLITVGVAASKIEEGEVAVKGVSLLKGKTLTLDPKVTAEGADVVFLTDNKSVATVDEKGVVTAKKAGTVKITVKSGEVELVYEITVVNELPAETTTTTTPAGGEEAPETSASSDSTTEEPTA